MRGLDLKAEAVRNGLPLYRVAAEARINPSRLSRVLNDREALDAEIAERIREAIERLAPREVASV